MKRLLILVHRYLGIPLSVVFVVWFVSGIVMIYTGGMPSVTNDERLARLEPVDSAAVRMSPEGGLAAAGIVADPAGIRLRTTLGRPAYRYDFGFGGETIVFADDGSVLEEVPRELAADIAAAWLGVSPERVAFVATLDEPDQWTLTLSGDLPLHEFSVDDGRATRIYVSQASGDVALVTTRASRFFAWIGVIPHWLYFTPLRLNQPAWYWTVVALSGVGCVLAALGLVLGVTQFRRSRPFSFEKSIRYRGLMRWHYVSGVLFGVFALTWVLSGLLSMEPFAWTRATGLVIPRTTLTGGALSVEAFPALADVSQPSVFDDAAEIEFVQVLAQPYLLVTRAVAYAADHPRSDAASVRERLHQPYPLALEDKSGRYLVDAETLQVVERPFDAARLLAAIHDSLDVASVSVAESLTQYDAYYYSRNREAPLPVLRIKFDDPLQTWYYIDPAEARIVGTTNRYSRIERWLFNGLHSLDFRFWYDKRPLWDIGMIALSLGALLSSGIGMWLGLGRLFRSARPQRLLGEHGAVRGAHR